MLSDSLEHAFDDMGERAFTEACLKADEMLPAVEAALQRLGRAVAAEEREKISQLVREVRQAREAHSLPSLKTALNALDKVTEPLAAQLVEGIMRGRL
jgi:molecular chaperone DnaK